jgi:hypothetical protein
MSVMAAIQALFAYCLGQSKYRAPWASACAVLCVPWKLSVQKGVTRRPFTHARVASRATSAKRRSGPPLIHQLMLKS